MAKEFGFSQKYRPKTVDDCVLPEKLKKTLKSFIDEDKNIPNMLFVGQAGIGKTTVAKALIDEVDGDCLFINGSNEGRQIDTLRTTIANFASAKSIKGKKKYVIIDEADGTNPETVQKAIRAFMEQFSKNCGFIWTCNYENKIIQPIRDSRLTRVPFIVPSDELPSLCGQFMKRCQFILQEEGIEYDKKALADIIMKYAPHWRKILNMLQWYTRENGKIDGSALQDAFDFDIDDLIEMLRGKEFTKMRKWVGTNLNHTFDDLCRKIYDQSKDFVDPPSIPQLVLILAEYQYKNAFVADTEINTVAMLTEIMSDCEFKK